MQHVSYGEIADQRDVFLSHRSVDKPWVRQLAARIENEYYNDRPLRVWLDEAEVRPGQSVVAEINRGLENSRFIALVLTPDYFDSPSGWTDAEWQAALFTDPAGRQARVIPLLVRDCPYIPILLRHLGMIDFRDERDFERSFTKLLRVLREEPLPRPQAFRGQLITPTGQVSRETVLAERAVVEGKPDAVEEDLPCNLLPVIRMPEFIWSAPIAKRLYRTGRHGMSLPRKDELKRIIRADQEERGLEHPLMPAFLRYEDRLYTFHDLEGDNHPLFAVTESDGVIREPASLWEDDPDQYRMLVWLLNMTVDRHCYYVGLIKDEKARFFFPPDDGKDRIIKWRACGRPRTPTKRYLNDDDTVKFWRHTAAWLPLMYLGLRFYLRITPTVVFTYDGTERTIMKGPKVGPLAMRWTGRDRNLNILYHTRFWAYVLARGGSIIRMRAGDQDLYFDTRPAFIRLPVGIADDRLNLDELIAQFPEEAEEFDWEPGEEESLDSGEDEDEVYGDDE